MQGQLRLAARTTMSAPALSAPDKIFCSQVNLIHSSCLFGVSFTDAKQAYITYLNSLI